MSEAKKPESIEEIMMGFDLESTWAKYWGTKEDPDPLPRVTNFPEREKFSPDEYALFRRGIPLIETKNGRYEKVSDVGRAEIGPVRIVRYTRKKEEENSRN